MRLTGFLRLCSFVLFFFVLGSHMCIMLFRNQLRVFIVAVVVFLSLLAESQKNLTEVYDPALLWTWAFLINFTMLSPLSLPASRIRYLKLRPHDFLQAISYFHEFQICVFLFCTDMHSGLRVGKHMLPVKSSHQSVVCISGPSR